MKVPAGVVKVVGVLVLIVTLEMINDPYQLPVTSIPAPAHWPNITPPDNRYTRSLFPPTFYRFLCRIFLSFKPPE